MCLDCHWSTKIGWNGNRLGCSRPMEQSSTQLSHCQVDEKAIASSLPAALIIRRRANRSEEIREGQSLGTEQTEQQRLRASSSPSCSKERLRPWNGNMIFSFLNSDLPSKRPPHAAQCPSAQSRFYSGFDSQRKVDVRDNGRNCQEASFVRPAYSDSAKRDDWYFGLSNYPRYGVPIEATQQLQQCRSTP
ncbi:hypothetical protein K438DRAFT_1762382 [Mycena galopus ATCC 62051]|nr:hypothetical protein K438DRAFT_1762382 [Mycena galopus ATCC 62051]